MTEHITARTPLICSDERHKARVADLERYRIAVEAVAEVLADHNGDDWSDHPATEAVKAALTLRPTPNPAATEATNGASCPRTTPDNPPASRNTTITDRPFRSHRTSEESR
ncbi:hypothetical protein [Streptomyces sp. NPDC005799]|uniref:hypothetical protein n=1 Tax=Streptomyces sp. NPDC005799 TaxID=3154678 RepID=UPI0033D7A10D